MVQSIVSLKRHIQINSVLIGSYITLPKNIYNNIIGLPGKYWCTTRRIALFNIDLEVVMNDTKTTILPCISTTNPPNTKDLQLDTHLVDDVSLQRLEIKLSTQCGRNKL